MMPLQTTSRVPGPAGLPILGSALEFKRDPLALLKASADTYGDLSRLKAGAQTFYLANSPQLVKHILKDNAGNYGKSNMMYQAMATLFGRATAIVDGDRWKKGFQLIQPSFTKEASADSVPLFLAAIDELCREWASAPAGPRNVSEDISSLTLRIIVRQMFGESLGKDEETITKSFRWMVDFIADRVTSVVRLPLTLPFPKHQEYRRTLAALDEVMYRLIDERWNAPDDGAPGMLNAWIRYVKAGNIPGFGPRDIRDEVIGIFVAAHGSTAVFLSWILHHLGANPDVQERARAELREVTQGKTLSYADVDRLTYLNMVVHESMRITPPGWIFSRTNVEEERLGGHTIPAGSMILISPYLMHHRSDWFPEPHRFDPERFAPEKAEWFKRAQNECAYIPFAAGKRICTGKSMALVEALVLIGSVLQNYRLSVPKGYQPRPTGRFTLNLQGGLILETEAMA